MKSPIGTLKPDGTFVPAGTSLKLRYTSHRTSGSCHYTAVWKVWTFAAVVLAVVSSCLTAVAISRANDAYEMANKMALRVAALELAQKNADDLTKKMNSDLYDYYKTTAKLYDITSNQVDNLHSRIINAKL